MKESKYPKLAERFKKLREERDTYEKDCTQDMLKEALHITKTQISELERGKREPSVTELKAYSRHFNAPMEYLLGISDNRHYQNMDVGRELGLSDAIIQELKTGGNNPKSFVHALNAIFEIGRGGDFLSHLSIYLFNDFENICEFNRELTEDDELTVYLDADETFVTMIPIKHLNDGNRRRFDEILLDIKSTLKEKGINPYWKKEV